MKRIVLFAMAVLAFTASSVAQKYALVDMEYILKNIPSYEMANEQLNQVSQRWQKECDDKPKLKQCIKTINRIWYFLPRK